MSLKYEPVSVEIESCTDLVQLSIPEIESPNFPHHQPCTLASLFHPDSGVQDVGRTSRVGELGVVLSF